MPTVGSFTLIDGKWTGAIRTMTISMKAQMVPVTGKADDGPDYRIFSDSAEIGAAWKRESKDGGTPYLSVTLDDPALPAPIRAAFFEDADDGTGTLVWNRQKPA